MPSPVDQVTSQTHTRIHSRLRPPQIVVEDLETTNNKVKGHGTRTGTPTANKATKNSSVDPEEGIPNKKTADGEVATQTTNSYKLQTSAYVNKRDIPLPCTPQKKDYLLPPPPSFNRRPYSPKTGPGAMSRSPIPLHERQEHRLASRQGAKDHLMSSLQQSLIRFPTVPTSKNYHLAQNFKDYLDNTRLSISSSTSSCHSNSEGNTPRKQTPSNQHFLSPYNYPNYDERLLAMSRSFSSIPASPSKSVQEALSRAPSQKQHAAGNSQAKLPGRRRRRKSEDEADKIAMKLSLPCQSGCCYCVYATLLGPVKVYFTRSSMPKRDRYVGGIKDGRGRAAIPAARKADFRGLVYDPKNHSFHPPARGQRPMFRRWDGKPKTISHSKSTAHT